MRSFNVKCNLKVQWGFFLFPPLGNSFGFLCSLTDTSVTRAEWNLFLSENECPLREQDRKQPWGGSLKTLRLPPAHLPTRSWFLTLGSTQRLVHNEEKTSNTCILSFLQSETPRNSSNHIPCPFPPFTCFRKWYSPFQDIKTEQLIQIKRYQFH